MGLFGVLITTNGFRHRERWAWFVSWYYPVFWTAHLVGNLPPGKSGSSFRAGGVARGPRRPDGLMVPAAAAEAVRVVAFVLPLGIDTSALAAALETLRPPLRSRIPVSALRAMIARWTMLRKIAGVEQTECCPRIAAKIALSGRDDRDLGTRA